METIAKLNQGQMAPLFRATDISGKTVDLSVFMGQRVLLSFFRNAACALCNLRVHELIQRHERYLKAGLMVLAVFEATNESISRYVGKQQAPFSIVGDAKAELYDLYGLETSEEKVKAMMTSPAVDARVRIAAENGFPLTPEPGSNFYRLHGDFLIDENGRIHTAYYATSLGTHLDFSLIDRFAEV